MKKMRFLEKVLGLCLGLVGPDVDVDDPALGHELDEGLLGDVLRQAAHVNLGRPAKEKTININETYYTQ